MENRKYTAGIPVPAGSPKRAGTGNTGIPVHPYVAKKLSISTQGECYVFYWCGMKKIRDTDVKILIRQCKGITHNDPGTMNAWMMAMNMKIKSYVIRLVNAYAPTNCDSSESKK